MTEPQFDMTVWTGRVDADETERARRWHQVIQPLGDAVAPGIALAGLASDEGVRRNQGRPGARRGPRALRQVLANFAVHSERPIYDAGDVECAGNDLESAQAAFATRVAALLDAGHFPVGLGGGHEIALASFSGLVQHLKSRSPAPRRVGILNLDAHFDLRAAPAPNSGTSFLGMADLCRRYGWPFHYCCLGVAEPSNTAALFDRARELGVTWCLDTDLCGARLSGSLERFQRWLEPVDCLYLSLCLDVLPAWIAPGVSAPAARGVPLESIELLIDTARASGKLLLADVAEMNPELDIDQHTARTAARLIYQLTQ